MDKSTSNCELWDAKQSAEHAYSFIYVFICTARAKLDFDFVVVRHFVF